MNSLKCALAAAALGAVSMAAGSVSAAPVQIFTDSFESPQNTYNWQVYPETFGDWSSTIGTGIEVQRSGVVTTAQDGNQYVELDSDARRGGDGSASTSNSSMTRVVNLDPGNYELTWYYRPRTTRLNDNIISAYVGENPGSLFDTMIGQANEQRTSSTTWSQIVSLFTITKTADYGISFLAGEYGALNVGDNTLGGFIDNVTLTRVSSVPVPGGMILLAPALFGLGVVGRRRRRAT